MNQGMCTDIVAMNSFGFVGLYYQHDTQHSDAARTKIFKH